MSNDYRNESRRRAPSLRWGTPGTAYPTPNPYDVLITEEVTSRAQAFEPVLYGTPHPTVPSAVLCHQSHGPGNNTDKAPIRVYANPRLAQEPYNLVNGGNEENDPEFPTFVRSYLLPRGYDHATMANPLSALIGLALTAGGSGYAAGNVVPGYGKVPLIFTGGTGRDAAGFAECVAGTIVAVCLTNTGIAYEPGVGAGLPIVTVAGGSGAGITALLQPTFAWLTKEEETPAEEPYTGYFVRVQRTYEMIPGPVIVDSTKYDPESDVTIVTTRQKKKIVDITPGHTIATSPTRAIITERERIDAIYAWEIVTTIPDSPHNNLASAKVEYRAKPHAFPVRVDVDTFSIVDGVQIGLRKPVVDDVLVTIKTYWVIGNTEPTLDLDAISYGNMQIVLPNGFSFGDCIHDDATIVYPILGAVLYPATSPSYSEFVGGSDPWVGTQRVIDGGVENDKHENRWKVQSMSVEMQ